LLVLLVLLEAVPLALVTYFTLIVCSISTKYHAYIEPKTGRENKFLYRNTLDKLILFSGSEAIQQHYYLGNPEEYR